MVIQNIQTQIKTERISSTRDEEVVSLKLVVTIKEGDLSTDVVVDGDIRRVIKKAYEKYHLEKSLSK